MTKKKHQFLVHNWRDAWKFFSVQAMSLNVVLLTTWASLPDKLQDAIPVWAVATIAISILLLGIFGRIKNQPGKR